MHVVRKGYKKTSSLIIMSLILKSSINPIILMFWKELNSVGRRINLRSWTYYLRRVIKFLQPSYSSSFLLSRHNLSGSWTWSAHFQHMAAEQAASLCYILLLFTLLNLCNTQISNVSLSLSLRSYPKIIVSSEPEISF